jgi:aspartate/methionine/tyrosine aminotransferase
MFSQRTAWDLEENDFARLVAEHRASGRPLVDLTVSNPTHCGFAYRPDLLAPLAAPDAFNYIPDPLGTVRAREAVSTYYRDHGAEVSRDRICLTTSTSEAYSFLFRLLCDPGDNVLIAQPSYPLFDYIARLDAVDLRPYPLYHDPAASPSDTHAWTIDFAALRATVTPRTRAIVVVHPNNPTGNFVSLPERAELDAICRQHNLALIVDEVFLDYALPGHKAQTFAAKRLSALTFVLSGLSKICGLPQMKCSWIAAIGPDAEVGSAMQRLEVIADTFLSMNAPVQFALPTWLASRDHIQRQIRTRTAGNLTALHAILGGSDLQPLAAEGGWTAVLRVTRTLDGVPFAESALARGVLVQPGEFYGLPEGRIVLSLLTPPEAWAAGLELLR